jgi:hypothetical protein
MFWRHVFAALIRYWRRPSRRGRWPLLQGCQRVYFQTKNPNLGKFYRAFDWKMLIYFMTILEHFTDIWDILWPFGTFSVNLVPCFQFWYHAPRKIWQPCIARETWCKLIGQLLLRLIGTFRRRLDTRFWAAKNSFEIGELRRQTVVSPIWIEIQGCQIFLGTMYQHGKYLPKDRQKYQMAMK